MKKLAILLFLILGLSAFQCEAENPPEDCIDPERIRVGVCTLDYKPVCGCDFKTYSNECSADIAGVKSWSEGECK